MPFIKNVNEAPSFFAQQHLSGLASDDLISSQVDPAEPQVAGLSSYTDPLVVDQVIAARLANFDPELFDLSPSSHLVRFTYALLGAAGIGGVRRLQTINRLAASMSGAHFLDLDGFWGALFGASRMSDERLPELNGVPLDPATALADLTTWETAASRDGKFRSRIIALAHAFSLGATYDGVRMAAEAVLGCEVDLAESWVLVDSLPGGYTASTVAANTWGALVATHKDWRSFRRKSYGDLQGGFTPPGDLPLSNRGEVVITPKRAISDEERIQVAQVLARLTPAGVALTVLAEPVRSTIEVPPRFVYADSSDWTVVSSINAYQPVADLAGQLYPSLPGAVEASRPALSKYSGERWEYSSRVASVTAYQQVDGEVVSPLVDAEYLMFADGTSNYYAPESAMRDARSVALSRAAMEGVLINYPYAAERFAS